jgi:putative acetyltransferase
MEIREECAGDEAAIRRVHREAFGGDAEGRLVDLLRERGKAVVSLVALEAGHVIGHVVFSPVTIAEAGDARALGLGPVGVLPRCQRRGIGSDLIREALHRCICAGYDLVVLVGAPQYYARFGFERARLHGLDNEYGVDEEFMVLELRKGSLERASGLVRYVPEFGELSS